MKKLVALLLALGLLSGQVVAQSGPVTFGMGPGLTKTLGIQNASPAVSGSTIYPQVYPFSYSTTHTVTASEMSGIILGTGSSSWTLTLPAANSAGFQAGQTVCVEQDGTGTMTIASPASTAVLGIVSLTQYGFVCIVSDGATANTWHSNGFGGGLALVTALSARLTLSGTTLDIASASISSAYLAPSAAATNVGALGYDTSGTLPNIHVDRVQGDANVALLDVHASFTKGQAVTPVALTYTGAGTTAIDFSLSNAFTVTLTGATSQIGNPSNVNTGQCGQIYITQDGTGGRLLTWASNWKFAGGTPPVLSTGAGAVDVLSFCAKTTSFIVGTLLANVL